MLSALVVLVIGLVFLGVLVSGSSDATASDAAVEHEADVEEFNNWTLSSGLTPWLPSYDDDD